VENLVLIKEEGKDKGKRAYRRAGNLLGDKIVLKIG
jgi:hypothetical protein